ncbi:MAG: glutathione S-transferase family protein [Myxococcota bacterium]
MGGVLRDGHWVKKSDWEQGEDGSFERQASSFRDDIAEAQPGRYLLYASLACPWACRVLMVRALLGLERALPVAIVSPLMGDDGWAFDPARDRCDADPAFGAEFLRDVYTATRPDFTGRVTVPVLWDLNRRHIVNNESSDLIRMLATKFSSLGDQGGSLYPSAQRSEIDAAIEKIYEPINNGVYRCGFAGTQVAYERAFDALFEALDEHDDMLSRQRYLCGDTLTLADICMFTTLIRFDAVYYVHFKCNGRRIDDYKSLSGYVRELYQLPGVASTVDLDHIKTHYYRSHPHLNPKGFVPRGPLELDFDRPHERDHLPRQDWTSG